MGARRSIRKKQSSTEHMRSISRKGCRGVAPGWTPQHVAVLVRLCTEKKSEADASNPNAVGTRTAATPRDKKAAMGTNAMPEVPSSSTTTLDVTHASCRETVARATARRTGSESSEENINKHTAT